MLTAAPDAILASLPGPGVRVASIKRTVLGSFCGDWGAYPAPRAHLRGPTSALGRPPGPGETMTAPGPSWFVCEGTGPDQFGSLA
jgi:hypothetical protein